MSSSMLNLPQNDESTTKPEIADDWEYANEDSQIAQVAERQKRLAQREAEAELIKFPPPTTSTVNSIAITTNQFQQQSISETSRFEPLTKGPIRLLKRPENLFKDASNANQKKNNAKTLTLQEREAAYQEARNRIFGEATTISHNETGAVNDLINVISGTLALDATPSTSTSLVSIATTTATRNYLSDVEMVTAPLPSTTTTSRRSGISQSQQRPPPLSSINAAFPSLIHMPLPPVTVISAATQPLAPRIPLYVSGDSITVNSYSAPATNRIIVPDQSRSLMAAPWMNSLSSPHSLPISGASPGCLNYGVLQQQSAVHQYGQPPSFAAGYLPPQSFYQGNQTGWWPPLPSTEGDVLTAGGSKPTHLLSNRGSIMTNNLNTSLSSLKSTTNRRVGGNIGPQRPVFPVQVSASNSAGSGAKKNSKQ